MQPFFGINFHKHLDIQRWEYWGLVSNLLLLVVAQSRFVDAASKLVGHFLWNHKRADKQLLISFCVVEKVYTKVTFSITDWCDVSIFKKYDN